VERARRERKAIGARDAPPTAILSGQLVRRVALLSLIAILGLGAAVYASLSATLRGVQRQLDVAGSTAARAFDLFLGRIQSDMLSLGDTLVADPEIKEVFRRTLDRQSAIFELALVDPQGHVLVQRRRVGGGKDQVVAEQPWLETVRAGKVYMGPVDYQAFGVPFATMAVAVADREGAFSGTLVAKVDLTALWNTLTGLRVGETGYVYVVDEHGQVLAYRDIQVVLKGATLAKMAGRTPEEMAAPGFDIYTGISGRRVIASSVPLEVVPWFAIVEQPAGEALQPFLRLAAVLFVALALVVLLVLIIARFTRRRIVLPLRLLREGVNALHQEYLGHRIEVRRDDELGALATAFNVMASQLQETVTKLERALDEAMQDITARKRAEEEVREQAEMLSSLHDTALDLAAQRELTDLLQAIVHRAVDLLDASGGGIYLYRPASDDLEYVFTHNVAPGFTGTILKRGEGLSGKVLETGRPLSVPDYTHWAGRSPQYQEEEIVASVAVPIHWGDHFLGVLDLDDEAPRIFSQEDVALLERFAPLAAAALENHRLLRDLQQQMERLKTTQAQLIQSAKMAAIGTLAAGVAHEINNPLTSIMGFGEVLMSELPPDSPFRSEVGIIAAEARRVSKIVSALLDLSRQTKPQRKPTDLNEVLRQTLILIGKHLTQTRVTIEVEEAYDPDIGLLLLDEGQMKQVFLNLITNAVQAMPEGGRLGIRSSRDGDRVMVTISDSGAGMSPDVQDHLFEPFFTTKPNGTGLGLSVSLGIVQEHGGRITVESGEGEGSTFTVSFSAGTGAIGQKSVLTP